MQVVGEGESIKTVVQDGTALPPILVLPTRATHADSVTCTPQTHPQRTTWLPGGFVETGKACTRFWDCRLQYGAVQVMAALF